MSYYTKCSQYFISLIWRQLIFATLETLFSFSCIAEFNLSRNGRLGEKLAKVRTTPPDSPIRVRGNESCNLIGRLRALDFSLCLL